MSVYCAFVRGQGGRFTSAGVDQMSSKAKAIGIQSDVFDYQEIQNILAALKRHPFGAWKRALVGYSLGAGTVEAISAEHVPLDLLIALDPSQLGYNYKLDPKLTKRSVLWHDSGWLSGPFGHAGYGLGFQIIHETWDTHLYVDLDPNIQANVMDELRRLLP